MPDFNIYWFIVGLFIALIAIRYFRQTKTRRAVFGNLDSAFTNGYFEPGEQLHNASPDEIAYDMTCYAPEFESARAETLTPYVRQWLRQKGL